MTAYTDAAKIANYLGLTLTSAQQTQAGIAAEAASAWIDEFKGRSWQAASPTTGEIQTVLGDVVWLDNRPVVSVTSVEVRADIVGAAWATLAAGQYEVIDAAAGKLQLIGWGNYLARVSYTHSATAAPSQIALAATIIAASLLGPTLRPNTAGLDSVSVGQNDVAVKFSVDYGDVPREALTLLGARGVVIA